MRTSLLFAFLVAGSLSNAQNWALINPTYKYNYSFGGTDTITNQVFVTETESIGPASFHFELNRMAVVCDTCGALGAERFIWPDASQWVGGEVDVVDDVWHFHEGTSRVILPLAGTGTTWLLDTVNGIWAEMQESVAATSFGEVDEHRTILLNNGSQIVLSRDHGVLSWDSGHELVGINGPDVGRTIPELSSFFPYVAGDILEYEVWYGGCDGIGGCDGGTREFKFTVDQGDLLDSAIVFNGTMVAHFDQYWQDSPWSTTYHIHSYQNSSDEWNAGRPELPWSELLFSYPGQLILTTHRVDPMIQLPLNCIAQHGIDAAGRYTIGCLAFELGSSEEVGHFIYPGPPDGPHGTTRFFGPEDFCIQGSEPVCGVTYVEGVGLTSFVGNYFERGEYYTLRGAMIGVDTLGTLTPDNIILGIAGSHLATPFTIQPNPVADAFSITGLTGIHDLTITDLQGRIVLRSMVSSARNEFQVSHLSSGIYLVHIPGAAPQRFIIAR